MCDGPLRGGGGAASLIFNGDVVVVPREVHFLSRRQRVQSGADLRRQSGRRHGVREFDVELGRLLVAVFTRLLVLDVTENEEK